MKKLFKGKRTKKIFALAMAVALVVAFIPSALAEAEIDGVYNPVTGLENWKTGETVYDGSSVTITKAVTGRPGADSWDIEMTITPDAAIQTQPIEIALVLDFSLSMDAGRIGALKTAVNNFLDGIAAVSNGNVSVSLVEFDRWAYVEYGMTAVTASNLDDIKSAVDGITTNSTGYTNIEDGLKVGISTFTGKTGVSKNVILFTDGVATADSTGYANGGDNGTTSNPNPKFSESAEAVALNSGDDITYYAIAFEITETGAAEQAGKTLGIISKSGTGNGRVFDASGAIELADVFTQIKQLVVSMVSDTIPDYLRITSVFGSNGNVKVEVIDTDGSGNVYTDYLNAADTIEWSPQNGELTESQMVKINYTVSLKKIPGAPYVYDNRHTNVDAKLTYSVNGELQSSLKFPEPEVRYETGMAIVNLVEKGTNASLDHLMTGFEFVSETVITDFVDYKGNQIDRDNESAVIRAPWSFRNAADTGTYVLVDVDDELDSYPNYTDYLDTEGADFIAELPTGVSHVKYIYELVPDGMLTVIKKVTGSSAPVNEVYEFELQIPDREPIKFSLKADEKKEFAFTELDINPQIDIKVVELKPGGTTYVDTAVSLNGAAARKSLEITVAINNIADSPIVVFSNNYRGSTTVPTPPPPTTPPTNPPTPTQPSPTPSIPDEEIEIDDGEDFPLGSGTPGEETIIDDEVPLGGAPETGDNTAITVASIGSIIMALSGIVLVTTTTKRREK